MTSPHSSFLTSNRLLITGGCGFIGLNLIKFLINRGDQGLRILDNLSIGSKASLESLLSELGTFTTKETKNLTVFSLSPQPSVLSPKNNSSLNSRLELLIGDIRNKEDCIKATHDVDAVIHLAAHAGVIPSIDDPFFDFDTNAVGTLNLLDAAVKSKVDNFIFASSNAPLGNQLPPLSEGNPPRPLSPYAASKLSCEAYCSAFYGSYGLKSVILRFSNVYGPYSLHKESVIAKFIKDGILNRGLTIYGDGTQTRDFIHVDDLCHAIHLFLNKSLSPHPSPLTPHPVWGETFHLGIGKETTILELANLIQKLFDNKITISFAPERKGEIKRSYSDITKAKEALGFSPRISLKEGAKSLYYSFLNTNAEAIKHAAVLSGSE